MPVLVSCNCGSQLRVKDDLVGKKVRCPVCQAIMAVSAKQPAGRGPAQPAIATGPPTAGLVRKAAPPRPQTLTRARNEEEHPSPVAIPRRQIVLRLIVLILGIGGGGLAGVLGLKGYLNTHDPVQKAAHEANKTFLKEREKAGPAATLVSETQKEVERIEKVSVVCYFLLAGGVLGLAGGVLAFLRLGKVAAPLMVLPAVGAGVIVPPSLILNSPLMLGGLLAILIKGAPRAIKRPRAVDSYAEGE
jgi:hypothetical protein